MKVSKLCLTLIGSVAALILSSSVSAQYVSNVIATGLNNPRGLAFAPDGSLYIAEAGVYSPGGPSTVARGQTFSSRTLVRSHAISKARKHAF